MRQLIGLVTLMLSVGPVMAEEATATSPPMDGDAPPQEMATEAAMKGEVARAIITSGITEREPLDELTTVSGEIPVVYFFTELRGMQGEQITHRWEHDGSVISEVSFEVKGPRWRVWSRKTLPEGATGAWKVHVVNSAGKVIASREFSCGTP